MESRIQCPVCLLYLHVGMNLRTHLDTHPQDQVYMALVNMTLTQGNIEAPYSSQSRGSDAMIAYQRAYQSTTNASTTTQPQTFVQQRPALMFHQQPQQQQHELPRTVGTSIPSNQYQQSSDNSTVPSGRRHIILVNSSSTSVYRNEQLKYPYGQIVPQVISPPIVSQYKAIPVCTKTIQPIISTGLTSTIAMKTNQSNLYQTPPPPYPSQQPIISNETTIQQCATPITTAAVQYSIEEGDLSVQTCSTDKMSEEDYADYICNGKLIGECTEVEEDFDISEQFIQSQSQGELENRQVDQNYAIRSDFDSESEMKLLPQRKEQKGLYVLSDIRLSPSSSVNLSQLSQVIDDDIISINDLFIPKGKRGFNRTKLTDQVICIDDDNDNDVKESIGDVEMLEDRRVYSDYSTDNNSDDTEIEQEYKEETQINITDCDKKTTKRTEHTSPNKHIPSLISSITTSVIRLALPSQRSVQEPPTVPEQVDLIKEENGDELHSNLNTIESENLENSPQIQLDQKIIDQKTDLKDENEIKDEPGERSELTPDTSLRRSDRIRSTNFRYSTHPKKLIVKFKKPFIPVVEEEVNMQPSIEKDVIKLECVDLCESNETNEEKIVKKEDMQLLSDQFDDPFSPLRLSFTPPLTSNPLETNESHISDDIVVDSKEDVVMLKDEIVVDDLLTENRFDIKIFSTSMEKIEESSCDGFEQSVNEPNHPIQSDQLMATDEIKIDEKPNDIAIPLSETIDEKSTIESDSLNPTTVSTVSSVRATAVNVKIETFTNQEDNEATPGPSRLDYGLTKYLGFENVTHDNDEFYTGVNLSPADYGTDPYTTWTQRFSPQYVPFENGDKTSYVDLDLCKNGTVDTNFVTTTSNNSCTIVDGCRTPSTTNSLNIRSDEKMPAKGEISEQESNGDIEGSWSHQMFPFQDTTPRYPSSYDTTVARESWSLSYDQMSDVNLSTVMPKFTPMITEEEEDIKPNVSEFTTIESLAITDQLTKKTCPKTFACTSSSCEMTFSKLSERRNHMLQSHGILVKKKKRIVRSLKAGGSSTSIVSSTITSGELIKDEFGAGSSRCTLAKIKLESNYKSIAERNLSLITYNFNLYIEANKNRGDDFKIPPILSTDGAYVCFTCHECFSILKSYDEHMATHPIECFDCGKTFKRWINFSIHMKRHLNIRDYPCQYCSKKFVLRQNLLDHMRTHPNVAVTDEAPYQCTLCPKRFNRFSNMVQHRARFHFSAKRPKDDYICSCGEVFHSEARIAWHRETHDLKPKCCPYCRERFLHRNSLTRHIRLSHMEHFRKMNEESVVECPVCKDVYKKSSIKAHMSVHSEKRTVFECTICNKRFTTKWNLNQHKWTHASRSTKPFKCTTCPKAFIREVEYTAHMNKHKALKPYTCDHCGCKFGRKYNWLRHTREHNAPKKHRCEVCGKDFHRAYYLIEHRRSHTGERPFECVICGKTSSTKTNHNKHIKIHHARDLQTSEA